MSNNDKGSLTKIRLIAKRSEQMFNCLIKLLLLIETFPYNVN